MSCPRCLGADPAPGALLCSDCDKELEEMEVLVAQGGLYWTCTACEDEGAHAPSEYTKAIRLAAGVMAPTPFGVIYGHCQQHTPDDITLH